MAYGAHWEWRGFGKVSSNFEEKFERLELLFPEQKVFDEYLWIPGLNVNIKLRTGAEGGFKFKRLENKDAIFEKWMEDENEIFYFPLEERAWNLLQESLAGTLINLPEYPEHPLDRTGFMNLLKSMGSKIVNVDKTREARVIQGKYSKIKVERVEINLPESTSSVGLENWDGHELTDQQQKDDLLYALHLLELENENLDIMSYLEAVKHWAKEAG